MFTPRKLLLASALLVGGLFTASQFTPAEAAAPGVLHASTGHTFGQIYAPSLFGPGHLSGLMIESNGTNFVCEGELTPISSIPWTGYAPHGTISGTIKPVPPVPGFPLIKFDGQYSIDTDGNGKFYTVMTTRPAQHGGWPQVVGVFGGQIRSASQINPITLTPTAGYYKGAWQLTL